MDFSYHIKGISLSMEEMNEISVAYRVFCTAEYIYDNYEVSKPKSLELAKKVREVMDKYDLSETEATQSVLWRYGK